jgi:hypothetical protein
MKFKRFFPSVAALCLMAGLPMMTSAYEVTTHHPIKVSTCNPQKNTYYSSAFTPAFYPAYAGPYWGWPSVYGPTYYQYPVEGDPTLAIDYTNMTQTVMKEIEFGLVVRGELLAEVRDVGTFSPGAEIKHKFGISKNVFPIQTSFAQCVPLKITFEDGTHWKNPHLPAYRASIYGKPHY